MGTRGIYGFYRDGVDKLTYNHFDSYPEELGKNIVSFIKETTITELNQIFDRIIMVEEDSIPNLIQVYECEKYSDTSIGTGIITDWYCLLRNTQGDLNPYKEGLLYMIEYSGFIKSSLFCEWGYIINLNDNILEIYRGFINKPNSSNNRYKDDEPYTTDDFTLVNQNGEKTHCPKKDYYSCEMIISFPLDNIPSDWLEQTRVIAEIFDKKEALCQ